MERQNVVALIGSAAHLIGEEGHPVSAAYSRPTFLRKLADGTSDIDPTELQENAYGTRWAARRAAFGDGGAGQPVEFVAKHLLRLDTVLIGSPLYVAAADPSGLS